MLQDYLLSELIERKKRNSNYSLRSFARDLGISPGHVSSLINKRKPLTMRQATQIVSKLNLSPSEQRNFIASAFPMNGQPRNEELDHKRLEDDEFALISEWQHLAILNLASLKNISSSPKLVAKRLNISSLQVIEAIQRLERLEYILVKDGKLKRLAKPLRTTTDIPSAAIRKYHKQNLELAKDKIDTVPIHLREFSSMVMPTNARNLARAKKMINDFKEKLCQELEIGSCKEIYTLNIQLFPLTSQEDEK
jgi:uncharacterized protein (TIGR02147 family)